MLINRYLVRFKNLSLVVTESKLGLHPIHVSSGSHGLAIISGVNVVIPGNLMLLIDYITDAELCHLFTQTLVELQIPLRGIELLRRAIRKIQLFDSQLTSIHADLCQLCLLSKCFKPALEFLDIDVTGISQEGGQFDSKYFLLYYYYGGMIYTALKNYDRALYFFEVCVTTPAMAVSYIMLEAYKKYILVSLILHGKMLNLPRFMSQVVNRYMKPLSQQYQELATAYQMNSCEDVQNIITKCQQIFTRDHNMGLVKQVLGYLYKKNIQRLTKTFLTLSLSDVASRVQLLGPGDAEKYILNMASIFIYLLIV